MTFQVCDGAALRCSSGRAPARLVVPTDRGLSIAGARPACVDDHRPGVHVFPFGRCDADALSGICRPRTPAPWSPGVAAVTLRGRPALDDASTLRCEAGGIIRVAPRMADGVELA